MGILLYSCTSFCRIRLGIEMNHQYHTPEELREIMGRLTGKRIDNTFRLLPPFYTDFGKILSLEKMYLSIPDAIFRIKVESGLETER